MPDARRPIADGAGLVDALHVPDAFPDVAVIVDPDNCVAPGTASNAVGVGGYCSPGGGQCDHVGKDGGPSICTADFSAPAHAWFCTVDCATNGDCGAGTASCVPAAGGMVCVPEGCGAFEADAAADAASDAAADARDAAPRDGSGGE
jgi:hypothetical protein